jgi:hydroxysqualene dehydroxylase
VRPGIVYVIGGGISGLSAAVALAARGARVEVIEAAPAAGGRCRSYYDPQLQQTIDNGNHLILSGNDSVNEFLRIIGTQNRFIEPSQTEFAFAEPAAGKHWTIRPNNGPVPWWILDRNRRVPGTRARDYFSVAASIFGRGNAASRSCNGILGRRLIRPLLLAALNTEPEAASVPLIAAVLRETLAKGGKAWRPRIASPTLSAAFVDPAVEFIRRKGGSVRFGQRLQRLVYGGRRVTALELSGRTVELTEQDCVILAVPPWAAASLVPGITAPDEFRAIISVHFGIAPPAGVPAITGVIDRTAEWIFAFGDRISVTISNADRLLDGDRKEIATLCWSDVAAVFSLPAELPPWQVVKERRATFAAIPEQEGKRPGARTRWNNLFLAGDWTDTGLPAAIEGAVRSGMQVARLAFASARV